MLRRRELLVVLALGLPSGAVAQDPGYDALSDAVRTARMAADSLEEAVWAMPSEDRERFQHLVNVAESGLSVWLICLGVAIGNGEITCEEGWGTDILLLSSLQPTWVTWCRWSTVDTMEEEGVLASGTTSSVLNSYAVTVRDNATDIRKAVDIVLQECEVTPTYA